MVPLYATEKPWTNFERGFIHVDIADPKTIADIRKMMDTFNMTETECVNTLLEAEKDEIWMNSRYQVNVRRNLPAKGLEDIAPVLVHLSIKRLDKGTFIPWRDKQRIKNELIGDEYEAVELYPAETRLVDTANQYHLWCFHDPTYRFPFGFRERRVMGPGESIGNAIQAPFEDEQ